MLSEYSLRMPGLLAFHAHPDDEVTSTGGTLARYASEGEEVVVVTLTDGAEGEVHNYGDEADAIKERLAEVRAEELAASLKALGVENHEFLGYRDSGMMGDDANSNPDCSWRADFEEATGRLIKLIRKYKPEVMTIYDPLGGYGHPDHIQVHRIGMAAYYLARDLGRFPLEEGEEEWRPSKLYWTAFTRSRLQHFAKMRLDSGSIDEEQYEKMRVGGFPDEEVSAWIDTADYWEQKKAGWRAHKTQIPADWLGFFGGDESSASVWGQESFVRIASTVQTELPETDLFAGLR